MVVSIKGGTGKTTIADELVYNLPSAGFINLDNQAGAMHDTFRTDNQLYTVVDTPGRVDRKVQQLLGQATVTVVPVTPSPKGIACLPETLSIVHNPLIVLNMYEPRLLVHRSMYNQVKQLNIPFTTLPRSTLFDQATLNNMSVTEYAPSSPAATAVNHLIGMIMKGNRYD